MPANMYRQSEYLAMSTAGKGKVKVVSMPQFVGSDGSSDEVSLVQERNKTVINNNGVKFILINFSILFTS